MKKNNFLMLTFLSFLMIFTSCTQLKKEKAALQVSNDSLKAVIANKEEVIGHQEQEINEYVGLILEIQETIDAINQRRKELTKETTEQSGRSTEQTKEQLRTDIKDLYSMVNNSRTQIANLKNKLKSSNSNISNLETVITNLEKDLNASNQEIIELRTLIEKQTGQITDLEQTITEQTDQIEDLTTTLQQQTNTLNTAWYVVASRKTLQQEGIIDRRSRVISENSTSFTQIDIRETTVIPLLDSKKVNILSVHPESSYQLVKDENNKRYINLTITDVNSFWSLEKRLVILIR